MPNSENPQPKPKPRPRADPPPAPPEHAEGETVVADQQEVDFDNPKGQSPDWVQVAIVIVTSAGGVLLLLSPLIAIAILKGQRAARRRKKGEVADQVVGAWNKVVDCARSLGFVTVTNHTRRESAGDLQEGYPNLPVRSMADQVDSSVFGPGKPETEVRDPVWKQGGELGSSLLATEP